MSEEIIRTSVIRSLATNLKCDPGKLAPMLKATAFAGCRNDEEFMAMCMVANTYRLNPITKQIYAFPTKGGGVMPMVSIDGWLSMIQGNPNYDGMEIDDADAGKCTVTIFRKDQSHPTRVTEYLDECKRATEPWSKWPKRMLRNKAIAQCARIAFGFSGVFDEDECLRTNEAISRNAAAQPKAIHSLKDILEEETENATEEFEAAKAEAKKETANE